MCAWRKRRTRSIVRCFSSSGSFHGNTVISALGASEATSVEACRWWSPCRIVPAMLRLVLALPRVAADCARSNCARPRRAPCVRCEHGRMNDNYADAPLWMRPHRPHVPHGKQ
jgi:hypothetical protein